MGWTEDVAEIVQRLPARFRLEEVYRFVPLLHHRHPENRHLEEKIRQQLQVLRDQGVIRFTPEGGTYHRVLAADVDIRDDLGLEAGVTTTRQALAELMGYTSVDQLRRGMFKPARGPLQNHLFLFHDERENPYGDVHEGERIYYVGQGQTGDQKLESYNLYLAEHLQRGFRVHYFVQPRNQPGKVVYRGEVVLEDFRRVFRPEESRSVLEFAMVPAPSTPDTSKTLEFYSNTYREILEFDRPPGYLETSRRVSTTTRVLRNSAFRDIVINAYQEECAVCGEPLRSTLFSELEAAHIVGVHERGPDDPRNGLSLCVRHHWAFDAGLFSLADDFRIIWLGGKADPHDEIVPGEQIQLPRFDWQIPAPFYLAHHRKKWRVT